MMALLLWVRGNKLIAGLIAVSVAAVVIVSVWQIGLWVGARREDVRRDAADAQAVAKSEKQNSAALEAASAERRADDASAAATEKELNDAVKALPDAVPSARRIALGCARLRRNNQDVSGLPQCA
jgi:uncharacterized protein (DUF1800 family)